MRFARVAAKIGVWLEPDDEPDGARRRRRMLALIAVDFPKFSDGRGYSIARLLRERYRLRGRAARDRRRAARPALLLCAHAASMRSRVRADQDLDDALEGLRRIQRKLPGDDRATRAAVPPPRSERLERCSFRVSPIR